MIEIFRNRDSATVGQFQSILESEGIRTYLRNEYVAATTILFPEATSALCILNEADLDRSVELIRNYIEAPGDESLAEFPCPKCGEKSPAAFAVCWNCGASLEAS